MKLFQLLLFVVGVVAFPTSAVTATQNLYTPLIIIFISILFLVVVFFVIKLVYMKHRRIGTIHAPPGAIPASSSLGPYKPHRGLLVGCLGSPAWETSLTSKLDGSSWRQRQRSSFAYQLHTRSTTRSASAYSKSKDSGSNYHFTRSTVFPSRVGHLALPPSSRSILSGDWTSNTLQQTTLTHCHPRYGDFGELGGERSRPPGGDVPKATRRASPSSIRLVDGPTHSNQVEFAFLSAVPPDALVASPLMGTRDSFQLSRCALKSHGKPVPPMPSLPSFLPFSLPNSLDVVASCPACRHREYLPPLRFSPLASVARVFHASHHVFEKKSSTNRIPDLGETNNDAGLPISPGVAQDLSATHRPIRNTTHKRSQSYKGLAIKGSLSRIPLVSHEVATLADEQVESLSTVCSRHRSVDSKKPLKPCLRQSSAMSMSTVFRLDSTRTSSMSELTGDQVSVRTPICDDDIGLLGLDRFRWNDDTQELQVRSSHMKQDSIAVVPVWV